MEKLMPNCEMNNTSPTSYEVIPNAIAFHTDLEREIKNAQSSIDSQFFVFEGDKIGKKVAENLVTASARGVRSRLIVDKFIDFSHSDHYIRAPRLNRLLQREILEEREETYRTFNSMRKQGVDVRLMNPLGYFYNKLLYRDHRKVVVKDGNTPNGIAYLGGLNICDHEMQWHTFMVKMKGDIVPKLQEEFNASWAGTSTAKRTPYSDGMILTDAGGISFIMPTAIDCINNAQDRILLESPYFWGTKFQQALLNAVERGVNVSVIVPLKNNKQLFVPGKTLLKYFATNGMKVFLFHENEGMTHAKALITDDKAIFGSSNLNQMTAGKVIETSVLSKNIDLISQLEDLLISDISKSTPL